MIMSLKLLKLRWRIFFWTITGRMNKIQTRLKVNLAKGNSENILMVFPMEEPSFRVALYAFRDFGKNDEIKREFIFLVQEQFRELFHLQLGQIIFIESSEPDNILSDERFLIQSFKQHRFDIIVDLNPVFHVGIMRLISLLVSDVKIGFTSPFSDKFYNIQLDISKSGIMEKGFKQINLILDQ